jgi:hypothetical protein
MKLVGLTVVVVVAALGLVGCGGSSSSTSSSSATGIEAAAERLEHTEEGCEFSEEEAAAHPTERIYRETLERCQSDEQKLRQMVEAGEGESTAPLPTRDDADDAADTSTEAVREIEERCEFFAEELRANAPANGGWKATLEGCKEELKDAEEPDLVAREEKKNEIRLKESRQAYREEREARVEAKLRNVKAKLRESKRAEIEALKSLCSASVSEAVAEEKRTGQYLREYWRECR